jgi:hypothetical protein
MAHRGLVSCEDPNYMVEAVSDGVIFRDISEGTEIKWYDHELNDLISFLKEQIKTKNE